MRHRDVVLVARLLGGREPTGPMLAAELVRHFKMHERVALMLADTIRERNQLKRELRAARSATTRAKNGTPCERELRSQLEGKTAALKFAIARNEVLARKLKERRAVAA